MRGLPSKQDLRSFGAKSPGGRSGFAPSPIRRSAPVNKSPSRPMSRSGSQSRPFSSHRDRVQPFRIGDIVADTLGDQNGSLSPMLSPKGNKAHRGAPSPNFKIKSRPSSASGNNRVTSRAASRGYFGLPAPGAVMPMHERKMAADEQHCGCPCHTGAEKFEGDQCQHCGCQYQLMTHRSASPRFDPRFDSRPASAYGSRPQSAAGMRAASPDHNKNETWWEPAYGGGVAACLQQFDPVNHHLKDPPVVVRLVPHGERSLDPQVNHEVGLNETVSCPHNRFRGTCTECYSYQPFAQDNQLASRTMGNRMAAQLEPGNFVRDVHPYQTPGGRDSIKGLFQVNGASGYEPMDRLSHSQHVFKHHPNAVMDRSIHLADTRVTPIDVIKKTDAQFAYPWVKKTGDTREFLTEAQARYEGQRNAQPTQGFANRVWDSSDFSHTILQNNAPAVPRTTNQKHLTGQSHPMNVLVRRIMTPHVMVEDQREFQSEAQASFSHPW